MSERLLSAHETRGALSPACHVQKLSLQINVELIYGQEMYGRHPDERAVPPPQVQHAQRACAQGYEFRPGYARMEKEIPGKCMETLEKKGGALPKRQAECPGTEGINNYRRSPHSFPQKPWETEARPVGTKNDARSMPRQRRVRRFSPAGGKNHIFVTGEGIPAVLDH